jgi:hypothetical protein
MGRGGRSARAALVVLGLALVTAVVAVGCEPALQTDSGIVTSVDSPSIGVVDGFELQARDGRRLVFDTSGLAFHPEFPPTHLIEHQALAQPITVTYRTEGDRLVVVRLDDA